jgi:PPOX class probable FMN-dependent enzyme
MAGEPSMDMVFDETINTGERLRELIPKRAGNPHADKATDHINQIAREFIALSPFVMIASIGADGLVDISPKGDRAGFVEVLDDKTLVIPDRLGNQRLDTFENLLTNSTIGLIFLIPGQNDTLRVAGKARIVRDAAIQERHSVNGQRPTLALVVTVEQAFMHCAKAFIRSHIWNAALWRKKEGSSWLAEWLKATAAPDETAERLDAEHHAEIARRLY